MGRAGEIKRADLPPGRMHDLNTALHELHRQAGFPSAREIARALGIGHSTVHNLFARARLPQYDQLMAVAGCLALRAPVQHIVDGSQEQALDAVSHRFHSLWQQAKTEDEVRRGWQPAGNAQQIVLHLNTRSRRVLHDLSDTLHLHHTIRALCPDAAMRESAHFGRLLYRLDRDRDDATLRVQTPVPAILGALPVGYARTVAVDRFSWPEAGLEGRSVRFLLDANATKAVSQPGQRSKRVALETPEGIAWWERQACRAGLATIAVRGQQLEPIIARRVARNPTYLPATRFEGTAVVTDPAALQRAVLTGIGRGRAYGLGLLCLSPPETEVPVMAPPASLHAP
ncbi:type I-E CRISPR-associated protein Cas6/Cse3/CasE [Streptomyces sp. NPDC087856]|uniref:type I-E CRISPR-associated protein Cas6/Cse3/CasE n=1 Tax=Streptomyces sp. NPDC087856 TaxID=3365811 RepID=UPI003815F860